MRYGICPVPLALPICVPARRRLLSRLCASVEMSLFFPVIEEAVMTVMLKDKPGPPTPPPPPSFNSTKENLPKPLSSPGAARAAFGWLEAGSDAGSPLPALPPPTPYKARLLAAFPADSTRPGAQVVPQPPVAHPCRRRQDPMSCWVPGCPALSMCRGLAALPITCLER